MDHQLKSTLPAGAQLGQTNSGFDWSTINGVEPPELRLAVLQAVATSIDVRLHRYLILYRVSYFSRSAYGLFAHPVSPLPLL
jgi:hypothetical protein